MECSICMEAIDETASLSKTECGHTFHFQCLYRWNRNHTTCPMCRKDFGGEDNYAQEIGQYVDQRIRDMNTWFLIGPRIRLNLEHLATRHYAEVPIEDFTGEIEERDIQLVMTQADVSHEIAERYLRYYHGDIVDTLMYLTEHKDLPIPPFRIRIRNPPTEPYEQKIVRDRLVTSRRKEAKSGYESA